MNLHEAFIDFLKQFGNVSVEEISEYMIPVIKVREFKKKETIIIAGEVENYINFISKGLVRKYYMHNQAEQIVQIAIEGHLISSQESLYTQSPSDYTIDAIEPTTLISIANDDLEKIFAKSHNMERLGRMIATHSMVLMDKRQISLIKQTPRERFLNFVNNYPEIIQRVPQKYLASYLNIKPETFSRFKHLIRNKKPVESVSHIGFQL
ncbi:MAG: Crp/Fnr family transcriptional regulator [Niabella sp.]